MKRLLAMAIIVGLLILPTSASAKKPSGDFISFTNVSPSYGETSTFAYRYTGRLPGEIHVVCYWGNPTVGVWISDYRPLPGNGIQFGINGITGGVPWDVGTTARCQAHLTDTDMRWRASSSFVLVTH